MLVNYCNPTTLWILPLTQILSTLLSLSHFTQACHNHDFDHNPFFSRLMIQAFDSSLYSKFVSDPHVLHIVTYFCFLFCICFEDKRSFYWILISPFIKNNSDICRKNDENLFLNWLLVIWFSSHEKYRKMYSQAVSSGMVWWEKNLSIWGTRSYISDSTRTASFLSALYMICIEEKMWKCWETIIVLFFLTKILFIANSI